MRVSKTAFLVSLALASSISAAVGYVSSSSNFDGFGYPTFASKTLKPIKPYSKDRYLVENYRSEVERYVEDSKNYVKAANNDVDEIGVEKAKAIRAANEVITEFNNFVRYGY